MGSRRSRRGGRPPDREIGRSVEEGPAVAVGVEDAVAGLGGGSRLLRLLLLCGLHHFYSERSRGAGVEEQCWRLEGRESSPRQRRQTGAVEGVEEQKDRQICATVADPNEEHREDWTMPRRSVSISLVLVQHCGNGGGNDCCGWGDRQWRLRQKRGCGRGKKMRAAAGAKQKAQPVATWVAAVTTRWVRLQAAGRDEYVIGDGNVAEAVAALKMSWPEIWRHYARLERMVARVVGPQRATADRGEESAPMIESWSGAVDSVAEASVISKRLSFDSKKK
ncbi:hypothetical protein GW17_00045510 [Ensete ventricosum]|nr:hypothetical protein GW17_00045510 [Ensete ventricosum]